MIGSLREGMCICTMDIVRQKAEEVIILFGTCVFLTCWLFRVAFVRTSHLLADCR